MITTQLRHFAITEFRHPELVDNAAAVFIDDVRDAYGAPLLLTSDARTPEENATASGSSLTSLHLLGRAFDLAMPGTPELLYHLVQAILTVAGQRPVELELVSGPTDAHVHVGLYPNPTHPSRLELALT